MFADDTNITTSGHGSSLADLEQETNLDLLNLNCWLKANKRNLELSKTEFMVIVALARSFLWKAMTK